MDKHIEVLARYSQDFMRSAEKMLFPMFSEMRTQLSVLAELGGIGDVPADCRTRELIEREVEDKKIRGMMLEAYDHLEKLYGEKRRLWDAVQWLEEQRGN